MRIKSFYASSVEAAVALAHRELGPDAMLVQSRKTPLEARHLGEYEVVCALVPENEEAAPATLSVTQDARLAQELADLRRQLDSMGRTITRSAWSGSRWSATNPAVAGWHARLIAADFDAEFATEVLDAVSTRVPGTCPVESFGAAVAEELRKRIPINATLAQPTEGLMIAALVGPPGSGKTTTLTKLAVEYGLAARRPVRLFSMDDYRVGGSEQLRSYAMILGAGFQALETVSALAQALDEPQRKGLILIDTPGYGARDMDRAADLARFLSSRPGISTHLLLTASTKSADLLRVVDRFEVFRPSSLLLTRLDETDSLGTGISAAARRELPLSFLGTGQEIPDDLEPATHDRLLDGVAAPLACAIRSAA